MPYADRGTRNAYLREYKKRKRRERGLHKQGRKPYTEIEKLAAKGRRADYEKEWRVGYYKEKPEKRLLWAAKKRAKERGLDFDIQESDIVIPTHCPYLGIELATHVPRGCPRTACMSLDRIDNSKGYVKGNIEVVSHLANTMKSNATTEQLLAFAQEITRRLSS
jgi:hypothetical protein